MAVVKLLTMAQTGLLITFARYVIVMMLISINISAGSAVPYLIVTELSLFIQIKFSYN